MVLQKLSTVVPAILLLLALAPSATAAGADPGYCDQDQHMQNGCTMPLPYTPEDCAWSSGCTGGSADGWSFLNDDSIERSIWAVNQNTGRVDYWECIEPGTYSGEAPNHGPQQGSTAGEVRNTAGTMVSWLGDFYSGNTQYVIEWRIGCWAPCDPLDGDVCIPMPFPDRIDSLNV